jgi:hypothetical protein
VLGGFAILSIKSRVRFAHSADSYPRNAPTTTLYPFRISPACVLEGFAILSIKSRVRIAQTADFQMFAF